MLDSNNDEALRYLLQAISTPPTYHSQAFDNLKRLHELKHQ